MRVIDRQIRGEVKYTVCYYYNFLSVAVYSNIKLFNLQ